ncbi:hypothetical protein VNO80_30702 [Phaseolus coccineus]|uniref:Uncharacterized protein n=1 Tax=Phaseolus coccineus TaxID=3886 RepID=A0AAN9QGD6_PHACN
MHPPSRCACFVVKASHNANCMVNPPTWLWHACGLRCVAYFNTCEHKIGGMASHRSREGGHHVWLVTGRGYCLVPLGKGFVFSLVAATRGKA